MVSHEDLRRMRFHEDAIARLAVAAEALKTVGNHIRSEEIARIRDEVIEDYARFLTESIHPPMVAAMEAR